MAELEEPGEPVGAADVTFDGDGVPVIKLSGAIDMSNCDAVRVDIQSVVERSPAKVVFDLGAVEFIDSSGLALLLRVAAAAQTVALRNPSAIVRRVIVATGLVDVLPIETSKQERDFSNDPDAVAAARRYVVAQLPDVPRRISDEIALMVSELATNCVRHTGTDFRVAVEHGEGRIRVEVTDSGSGMPEVRSPEPDEPSGRGLLIVRELADAFGILRLPGSEGKTVWFVMELDLVDHA